VQFPAGRTCYRVGLYATPVEWRAVDVTMNAKGSQFVLHHGSRCYSVSTNVVSLGNIYNVLVSIAFLSSIDISIHTIITHFLDISQAPQSLRVFEVEGVTIVDNSHNTNITGIFNSLELVPILKQPSIVFINDVYHELRSVLSEKIISIKPELIILTGTKTGEMKKILTHKGFNEFDIVEKQKDTENSILVRVKKELQNHKTLSIVFEGPGVYEYVPSIVNAISVE
jgi:UDP-N-acetylmuramyl pentapeptide synthase